MSYYEKLQQEQRQRTREEAEAQALVAQHQAIQAQTEREEREERERAAKANRAAAVSEAEGFRREARELRERAAELVQKAEMRLRFSGPSEAFAEWWESTQQQQAQASPQKVEGEKEKALRDWSRRVGEFHL